MFQACSRSCSIKRIVSSTYSRIDKPPFTRCDTTPVNCRSSFALLMRIVNMSTTITTIERLSPLVLDPPSPTVLALTEKSHWRQSALSPLVVHRRRYWSSPPDHHHVRVRSSGNWSRTTTGVVDDPAVMTRTTTSVRRTFRR